MSAPCRYKTSSEVHAGDLLAQIVDDDYRATVAQLEAGVASAAAQIQALKAQRELQDANVQAARATIDATIANVEQNSRDVARQQRLLKTGSSSTEAEEKLQTLRAQLAAQLAQNRAQATAAARQLAVLSAQQAQAEASMVAQTASLEIARINLGYTRILAPQDGVIGQRQIKPGQYVGVGGPNHHAHPAAARLGDRELQGNPVDAHGRRRAGRDQRGYFSGPSAARSRARVCAGRRLAVRPAAARQCDRKFHQGGSAHCRQNRDRRRRRPSRPSAPPACPSSPGSTPGPAIIDERAGSASSPGRAMAAPAPPTEIPWMGLLGVLLGTFISTLTTRLSTFGLADIRGAVHAGFDEGAWITTAQTVGQMLVAPLAIWWAAFTDRGRC